MTPILIPAAVNSDAPWSRWGRDTGLYQIVPPKLAFLVLSHRGLGLGLLCKLQFTTLSKILDTQLGNLHNPQKAKMILKMKSKEGGLGL